jgi:hypothetical protein
MQSAKPQPFSYDDGGDAIDLLRGQHREIEQLFGALERARTGDDKARILAELGDLLAVHLAVEERVFYPGLTPGPRDGDGRGFVVLAVEDHFGLKRRLCDLLDLDVNDDGFDEAAGELRDELATHTAAEERLFPRIRRRLPRARLRRLEYEMRVLEFQIRTDAEPRRLFTDDGAPAPLI